MRYGGLLPLLTGCSRLPVPTGTGRYFRYRNLKVDGIKNEFDEQRTQDETAYYEKHGLFRNPTIWWLFQVTATILRCSISITNQPTE